MKWFTVGVLFISFYYVFICADHNCYSTSSIWWPHVDNKSCTLKKHSSKVLETFGYSGKNPISQGYVGHFPFVIAGEFSNNLIDVQDFFDMTPSKNGLISGVLLIFMQIIYSLGVLSFGTFCFLLGSSKFLGALMALLL